MATVRDVIEGSLRKIGALAVGENASADEASDALTELNNMLSSWSAGESLTIYTPTREEFSLTPSDATYTMGSGGDFNTTRPVEINEVRLEVQTSNPYELPVKILNQREWADKVDKGVTGEFPSEVYIEPGASTVTLNFWPIPTVAHKAVIYSLKPLSSFSSVNDTVTVPPGYEQALIYNLALLLAPEYGKEPSAVIVKTAADSKANIKRRNKRERLLKCDPAITSAGYFNIDTGDY